MDVDQTRAVAGFSSGKDGKGTSKGKGKNEDGKGKGKGKKGDKSKDQKPRVQNRFRSKDTAGTATGVGTEAYRLQETHR